ncbi:hypothetical protein WDU94_012392 [Cyamophila willieti]
MEEEVKKIPIENGDSQYQFRTEVLLEARGVKEVIDASKIVGIKKKDGDEKLKKDNAIAKSIIVQCVPDKYLEYVRDEVTAKESFYCYGCGKKGHKKFECKNRRHTEDKRYKDRGYAGRGANVVEETGEVQVKPNFEVSPDEEAERVEVPFRELIGSLMYISLGSRPDITYAVSFLSRYLDKPNRKVWTGAKRVLRYLQHTKRMAIVYKQSNDKRLVAFSDSDWAQDSKDGKSVSGGIVFFCGNPVMWLSKKQTCVTLSSTEAEYVAAALISTEIISLKSICKDLINEDIETVLCMDNQGAMKISMNYENSRRSKHIDIKYHFIKDCVHQNAFSLQYVDTSRNTADILTKSLTRYVFESHTERMNLVNQLK